MNRFFCTAKEHLFGTLGALLFGVILGFLAWRGDIENTSIWLIPISGLGFAIGSVILDMQPKLRGDAIAYSMLAFSLMVVCLEEIPFLRETNTTLGQQYGWWLTVALALFTTINIWVAYSSWKKYRASLGPFTVILPGTGIAVTGRVHDNDMFILSAKVGTVDVTFDDPEDRKLALRLLKEVKEAYKG